LDTGGASQSTEDQDYLTSLREREASYFAELLAELGPELPPTEAEMDLMFEEYERNAHVCE